MEKKYSNGDITVVWKPEACIHSTLCWRGLTGVFNPKKRPWIDIEAADSEAIIAQVEKCPSGALSFFKNDAPHTPSETIDMETIVEVSPNGPLMVYGNIKVKDLEGNETVKHKVTAFCRCGGSQNKPYCDGTHGKIGFTG